MRLCVVSFFFFVFAPDLCIQKCPYLLGQSCVRLHPHFENTLLRSRGGDSVFCAVPLPLPPSYRNSSAEELAFLYLCVVIVPFFLLIRRVCLFPFRLEKIAVLYVTLRFFLCRFVLSVSLTCTCAVSSLDVGHCA